MTTDPFDERRPSTWRGVLLGIVLAVAVLNVAWLVFGGRIAAHLVADGAAAEDGGIVWTCPMHPTVESNKASTCPVCAMDLVPLMAEGSEMSPEARHAIEHVAASPAQRVVGDYATVAVRSTRVHPAGTEHATSTVTGSGEVVGRVVAAEDARATVTSWIAGRVDKLLVEETGKVVDEGQPLARIYSEALSSAQADYLAALGGDAFARTYADAAERKLRLYGMSTRQIERLAERGKVAPRVTIHATEAGTVTERFVQQGQYVAEGAPLFTVTDLSTVWVVLDVPAELAAGVRPGQTVPFRLDNAPALGELTGTVDFISPIARAETQAVPVRLVVDNPDGALAPQMLARATLTDPGGAGAPSAEEASSGTNPTTTPARHAHLVPRTAVLETGARAIVWVETGPHTYAPRRVELGARLGQDVTVLSGLTAGDRVVRQAGFMLDPESPLPMPDDVRMRSALDDVEAADRLHVLRHVGVGEYFCPMHPEVHREASGRCPKCNMELVEMTAELHARVSASSGGEVTPPPPVDPIAAVPVGKWYCPMDAEWVQDGPGDCPICKMALVEKTPPEAAP